MARTPETNVVLGELGRRIANFRRAAGLTQEEAAATAGIDYKRWQRLEEGTVNPTVQTLVRVALAVGVTFWTLCGSNGAGPAKGRNSGHPP